MTNSLVDRLRNEQVEQSSRCGEEDSQNRALLAEEAANEIERLRAALTISRGQWIHSVNAEQCMIALGCEAEWREIEARRSSEPEVGETFPSVIKAQADTIGVLARRVVRMGSLLRDHACPQCVPEGGDLVNYGFVCAYHLASYLVTCPEYQLPDASRDADPRPIAPWDRKELMPYMSLGEASRKYEEAKYERELAAWNERHSTRT